MSSTNRVLAGPTGDCCFTGYRHEGTPVGTRISIADVPTYLAEPSKDNNAPGNPEKILIFLADIVLSPRIICSYRTFSLRTVSYPSANDSEGSASLQLEAGFTVLGIDYFLGDAVDKHDGEAGFDRDIWIEAMQKIARDALPKWWEAVKAKYGNEAKYCVSGYCFGASYTMDLSADNDTVTAAIAHPAFLNENHFRNIAKPLMLSCAESDFLFPTPNRRIAEDILVERKAQYFFQIFSGVEHGFTSRGDPSAPDHRWGKEQSALGISMWFHRFLDERTTTEQKL